MEYKIPRSVGLSDQDVTKLKALSERMGCSGSEVVRRLIEIEFRRGAA